MGRRAAYVLNLTPEWRPDWGGLLQFYDAMGNVSRAFTPGFNVLNIFRVPQPHSVSWVTPLAAAPRYAVTGWLRAAAPGA
jgi:Rps23 Pro-64 3,4-dihydroxylase Tpa1-like proline 4-hydroxylase